MSKLSLNFMRFLIVLLLLSLQIMVSAQEDSPLKIVASHSILADVVSNVAGDSANVISLVPAGSDPHSFQPSARDIAGLVDADVVFINGAFFEEGLLEVIQNAADDINIVTTSSCVQIIPFGASYHEEDEQALSADSALDSLCTAHDAEVQELFPDHIEHTSEHALGALYMLDCRGGHDQEGGQPEDACDPHVWMNPENVMYWTLRIRDVLIELDPANRDVYAANATTYLDSLHSLIVDVIDPMIDTVPQENRILVTNHDAFGYFADAYGFEIVGTVIPGGSTLAEPSASDIAALIDTVRGADVHAIFAENTINPDLADQIAAETDAEVYSLYSGSLSDSDGPADTYLNYMQYNVTIIVQALTS